MYLHLLLLICFMLLYFFSSKFYLQRKNGGKLRKQWSLFTEAISRIKMHSNIHIFVEFIQCAILLIFSFHLLYYFQLLLLCISRNRVTNLSRICFDFSRFSRLNPTKVTLKKEQYQYYNCKIKYVLSSPTPTRLWRLTNMYF